MVEKRHEASGPRSSLLAELFPVRFLRSTGKVIQIPNVQERVTSAARGQQEPRKQCSQALRLHICGCAGLFVVGPVGSH